MINHCNRGGVIDIPPENKMVLITFFYALCWVVVVLNPILVVILAPYNTIIDHLKTKQSLAKVQYVKCSKFCPAIVTSWDDYCL